jgi:hypothetical protein
MVLRENSYVEFAAYFGGCYSGSESSKACSNYE